MVFWCLCADKDMEGHEAEIKVQLKAEPGVAVLRKANEEELKNAPPSLESLADNIENTLDIPIDRPEGPVFHAHRRGPGCVGVACGAIGTRTGHGSCRVFCLCSRPRGGCAGFRC